VSRALRALAASSALIVLLPACNSSGGGSSGGTTTPPPPAAATVDIKNIAFNPRTVNIKSGQTVLWKFDDGAIAHNVTGDTWRSADRTSGYYTHTFDGPGEYAYKCTIHTGMNGDVFVTP